MDITYIDIFNLLLKDLKLNPTIEDNGKDIGIYVKFIDVPQFKNCSAIMNNVSEDDIFVNFNFFDRVVFSSYATLQNTDVLLRMTSDGDPFLLDYKNFENTDFVDNCRSIPKLIRQTIIDFEVFEKFKNDYKESLETAKHIHKKLEELDDKYTNYMGKLTNQYEHIKELQKDFV